MRPLPPIERLRELFDYDPETGVISWKHRADVDKAWNAHFAGKPAGCIAENGYLQIRLDGAGWRGHRIAWALHNGVDPFPFEVDHWDGDRLNNRPGNFRLAERVNNARNCKRQAKARFPKGVKFDRARGKYKAQIRVSGGRLESPRFDTPEEAHVAYQALAVKHHGDFARFE